MSSGERPQSNCADKFLWRKDRCEVHFKRSQSVLLARNINGKVDFICWLAHMETTYFQIHLAQRRHLDCTWAPGCFCSYDSRPSISLIDGAPNSIHWSFTVWVCWCSVNLIKQGNQVVCNSCRCCDMCQPSPQGQLVLASSNRPKEDIRYTKRCQHKSVQSWPHSVKS